MRQIVVSVDTEEDGLWSGSYPVTGNTTHNLRGLERFQAECWNLGVPPTYLIDAPVLEDRLAIAVLARWQASAECEVGTHCHPWCSPPLANRPPTTAETFLCNLPSEVQFEKLKWLTEQIAQVMGKAPTSYRAGRYGFNDSTASILIDIGYRVDSSVLPLFEYTEESGPDFRNAQRLPAFYLQRDEKRLVELPVTSGFTQPGYQRRKTIWTLLRKKPWTYFRAAGIVDRLGIARRIKLSPEGTSLEDLKRLVDAPIADGVATLVLLLHSSSLVVGHSPYARQADDLERLYLRLIGVIRHATATHGCRPATLTQAADGVLPFLSA